MGSLIRFELLFSEHGNQRCEIIAILENTYSGDLFTLHPDLYDVGGFELSVTHMILFHSHKYCIGISFGIVVTCFKKLVADLVVLLPGFIVTQLLNPFLDLGS